MAVWRDTKAAALQTIGNDIVDLKEEEPGLHPRFSDRVFTSREQQFIAGGHKRLWLNWSAKEAGYKAIKRIFPETVFSPREFELINSEFITYRQHALPCSLLLTDDYAYCLCAGCPEILKSENIFSWIAALPFQAEGDKVINDPSAAVRLLARTELARIFKCDPAAVEISKTSGNLSDNSRDSLPLLLINGEICGHLLSFTHHGRFIACAVYFLQGRK